jgi:L-lactate dehydrogenase (cytochrome)
MPVLFDGGIRRGTDVLKAMALGARFVFVGRPLLYAAAVGGAEGVGHAIALMKGELDRDLALLGIDRPESLGHDSIFRLAEGVRTA